MLSRNLRIALILSLVLHLGMLSMVQIVAPGGVSKLKPFTRVTFLGPVLQKTAFDIMLENITPVARTSYADIDSAFQEGYLKVMAPKVKTSPKKFYSSAESGMNESLLDFFSSRKSVPDFILGINQSRLGVPNWAAGLAKGKYERRVVYRPGAPVFLKGLYGDKESFVMNVRAQVSPAGDVVKAEPVTTTGYPELDIMAVEYVKEWMFEPSKINAAEEEWITLEVHLR